MGSEIDNPLAILYREHDVIGYAANFVKKINENIGNENKYLTKIAEVLILFFREYADKYHHFKEEEILFPEIQKKNELMGQGIVSEMLTNHEDFRLMLQEIETDLKKGQIEKVFAKFSEYINMLLDHIAVENEELFQAAITIFSKSELEKIRDRFKDFDHEHGLIEKENLENMVKNAH